MTEPKLLRGPRAHSVAWMIRDDWIEGTVTCHATVGADCRLNCPEGCESWHLVDHEHELVDYGKCLVSEWIEEQGMLESHVGDHKVVDGFITVEWDGECCTWRYSDD